jgi:hypothetical protein
MDEIEIELTTAYNADGTTILADDRENFDRRRRTCSQRFADPALRCESSGRSTTAVSNDPSAQRTTRTVDRIFDKRPEVRRTNTLRTERPGENASGSRGTDIAEVP